MADYPDWGGTPLVTGDIIALQETSQLIAQGATANFQASVIRPGYNIRLEIWNNTDNVTALPANVQVSWLDQASGLGVNKQNWNAFGGRSNDTHIIRGHGPTEGDIMSVTIKNNSAGAVVLGVNLLVVQALRTFTGHDWRTDTDQGTIYPGFANATPADLPSNIAAAVTSQNIANAANFDSLMPLISGPAHITKATTGGNATLTTQIFVDADIVIPALSFVAIGANSATQPDQVSISLPRSQCRLRLTNSDSVARLCSAAIVSDVM